MRGETDHLCDLQRFLHVALSETGNRADLHRAAIRRSHVVVHRLKAAAFGFNAFQAIDEFSGGRANKLIKKPLVFGPFDQRSLSHLLVDVILRTKDLLNGDIAHAEIVGDLPCLISSGIHVGWCVMQPVYIAPFFKDLFSGSVFGRRAQRIAIRSADQTSCNFFTH